MQTPASNVIPVFTQFLARGDAASLLHDEKLKTALELFNAYFYEASIRAKFLTLVTILEVLAPVTGKHHAAQVLVTQWKMQLEAELGGTRENDARLALEALDRELDFRRETSIRQRVRQLVRDQFADVSAAEREELERQAVKAYDARGALIHSGRLPAAELDSAHEHAANVVRRILSKRLGLAA